MTALVWKQESRDGMTSRLCELSSEELASRTTGSGQDIRRGNRGTVKLVLHSQKTVKAIKKEKETKVFDSEKECRKKAPEFMYFRERVKGFYNFLTKKILIKYQRRTFSEQYYCRRYTKTGVSFF